MDGINDSPAASEQLLGSTIRSVSTSRFSPAVFGWMVPATIFIFAVYYTVEDFPNPEIPWSVLAASVACMTCIAVNRYQLFSFITLICTIHLMNYPVAAFLNLLLEEPALAPDLWYTTDLAMWACTLGSLSMSLGVMLVGVPYATARPQLEENSVRLTGPAVNLALFAVIFPTVIVMMAVGSYYVRFTGTYGETKAYSNILSYFQALAQAGIFLQLFRYVHTKKEQDALLTVALIVVHALLFLPSGTRSAAFGFLPGLILVYAAYERSLRKVLVALVIAVTFMAVLSHGAGVYRSSYSGVEGSSLWDRIESIIKCSVSSDRGEDHSTNILYTMADRLSEYQAVGRVIEWTPANIPFKGAEGLEDIPEILLPVSMFREKDSTLGSSGLSAEEYGIGKPSEGLGSSPIMIMGDLFRRWGWLGIAFGMFFIGIGLVQMDRLLRPLDVSRVLFVALFFPKAATIPVVTVPQLALFARELLAAWVIAMIVGKFLERKFSKPFVVADGHGC